MVLEREKELRFTRASQSVGFWLMGATFGMASLTLLVASFSRDENTALPHPAWSVLPMLCSLFSLRLALHLTRHAYLILTPLGMDVFPFFRPAAGMRTIFWSEIKGMDLDSERGTLRLHFNHERNSGVCLSLRPIARNQRDLLIRAIEGRLTASEKSDAPTQAP